MARQPSGNGGTRARAGIAGNDANAGSYGIACGPPSSSVIAAQLVTLRYNELHNGAWPGSARSWRMIRRRRGSATTTSCRGWIDSLPATDERRDSVPMGRYGTSREIAATIAFCPRMRRDISPGRTCASVEASPGASEPRCRSTAQPSGGADGEVAPGRPRKPSGGAHSERRSAGWV